jgi:8-oxo-dGTP diphosphatase
MVRCFCICNGHEAPALTVDIIIERDDKVLLIKRKNSPFKGQWAIPGGFVECGETTEEAAIREAKEETGLDVKVESLLGVYSDPSRDPRGHVVSICYIAKAKGKEKSGSDAEDARFFNIEEISNLKLAFDHGKILEDYNVLRKMRKSITSKR